MADSIPALRRQLAEARMEIAALQARPARVETREVVRTVEVPVIHERLKIERVVEVKEVFVTDPALESTIRDLQERLRECISASGL